MSFTKKVISEFSNIGFKQAWWRWKANSNIYKVMFHEICLILMFTRSKRATKRRLKSWTKIKGNNPIRKNLVAPLETLMKILFQKSNNPTIKYILFYYLRYLK